MEDESPHELPQVSLIVDRDKILDHVLDDYIECIAACVVTGCDPCVDMYMKAYTRVYTWHQRVGPDKCAPEWCEEAGRYKFAGIELYFDQCAMYLEAFSDMVEDDEKYDKFDMWMRRFFNGIDRHGSQNRVQTMARSVREERARRVRAARAIQRALWRCVQRRQQMELLDELYKPGGLGARRAQERFERMIQTF